MTRKTSFEYFYISKGYAERKADESIIYLSENGLQLLDQLLHKQASKNRKNGDVK